MKKEASRLDFLKFKTETKLTTDVWLGRGVRFGFDPNTTMNLMAVRENNNGIDRLIIRGSNRQENDWIGLEIDVSDQCRYLDVTFRYAPAEKIYLRIYYKMEGKDFWLDEPDRVAPTNYGTMHFSKERWMNIINKTSGITDWRLTLLLPSNNWFAMGLQEIREF